LTLTGNEKVTGEGTLKVYSNGVLIGQCTAGDSLYKSTNSIVASVNLTKTYPDYYASCPFPENDPNWIEIQAPAETGSSFNGYPLTFDVTGSFGIVDYSATLAGGSGSYFNYSFWNETSADLPNANLKYWGTKKINWDVFQESQWEDGYAHSWEDYSFNQDWLGGFQIHTAYDGDHLMVTTASDTYPFPVGVTFSAAVSGSLTLQEVADQLNSSSDSSITNFYYEIMPPGIDGSTLADSAEFINANSADFSSAPNAFLTPPWR
jgi:hypothetical protein